MAEHTNATDTQPRQLPDGFEGPRACGPYELPGVLDLINLVLRTLNVPPGAPHRWPSMGFDYPHVYHPGNLDNIRVVLRDGRVVASVGIYSTVVRTPRGEISVGGINAVATHPDFRRLGLASAVMTDAHARMRAEGHQIALLGTGIQDFYRRLGWESAGRQLRFVFDRGNITFLPDPAFMEITEDWRPHAVELCALHNAEPMVSPRSVETFVLLLERKLKRIFVASRGGRVVAYAGVSDLAIREYGGVADDVAALVRGVFRAIDDPDARTSERAPGQRATIELAVTTPTVNSHFPGLLQRLGIPFTLSYLGMIKILDAPCLFDALEIHDVALDQRAGAWILRYNGLERGITERELVKLVFGPELFSGFAPDVFPVDFFQWPLDRV